MQSPVNCVCIHSIEMYCNETKKNITSDMKTKTYYVGNLISEVISLFMTY